MTDSDSAGQRLPLSHLPLPEKTKRAGSFGQAASHYERFRPGPPVSVVDWILPSAHLERIVDLGAGTGALTRLLTDRATEVVAVEPDDRMRSVLAVEVPGATAVNGRGEEIPLPDSCADVVLASSSWHWMDPVETLREVGRVLVPGGVLGVLWSGPDPDGPFLAQARAMLSGPQAGSGATSTSGDEIAGGGEFASLIMADADRPLPSLEIPEGLPFEPPEHQVFTWDVALTADDLISLLGTFSWIITMPPETREHVMAEARRLLRELLGVEGEVTVDVAFRADAWRSHPSD